MIPEFQPWPKIARLNRDIIITEKIDGTNAAIGITEEGEVYAQSRTRIITPEQDNMGFAAWVKENEEDLKLLGPGLHFGEWWGQKIQRGYGLRHRVFSLFNTRRWAEKPEWVEVIGQLRDKGINISVVPILYQGPRMYADPIGEFKDPVEHAIFMLNQNGSYAVPGFMDPEGIVVFHTASQIAFKVTCQHDEQHKGEGRG